MQVAAGPIKFHVTSFALRMSLKIVPWDITRHRIICTFLVFRVIMKKVYEMLGKRYGNIFNFPNI